MILRRISCSVHRIGDLIKLIGEQVPYRSRVIVADLWPSIVWTTLTFAPAAMASDAAVWRSACGVSRSSLSTRRTGRRGVETGGGRRWLLSVPVGETARAVQHSDTHRRRAPSLAGLRVVVGPLQ